MPASRTPRATYRLQLNAGFTLSDARALVPYLAALGVSHLYLSPVFKARPGSTHGYDVVSFDEINPELGTEADLLALADALRQRGMGILLDWVPNHMGVGGTDNGWWLDVLEWGRDSPFAGTFDINWRPGRGVLAGKVLLPFLGDHYGAVLERGELRLKFDAETGSYSIWYWDHRFPVDPRSYPRILSGSGLPSELVDLARSLKGRAASRAARQALRGRADQLKAGLRDRPSAAQAAAERLNGQAGDPASFRTLHRLMEDQNWRASYWRVAADEINYRRFFDINDLAGLRMEDLEVFQRTHAKLFDYLERGVIEALRIDHVDGLFQPAQYCRRLQARVAEMRGASPDEQPLYLLVEKITAPHEALRRDWPVAGTTGYDFCNEVMGLLVDSGAEPLFNRLYAHLIGGEPDFEEEVYAAKLLIMDTVLASELRVLTVLLAHVAETHWRTRDYTLSGLREALRQVVACLPVYRTYVTPRRVTDTDRRYVDWAVARARKLAGGEEDLYSFLRGVLTTDLVRGRAAAYPRALVLDFAMKLQQYSGPVMAKGFEDTALYRYNRLVALNEVGGEPRLFGLSPANFWKACRQRRPHAMLATATHDTKRGEDTRLRIAALSELPHDWRERVSRWIRLNQGFKTGGAPDANDEYFLYQTMVGAWPCDGDGGGDGDGAAQDAFLERLQGAMQKSLRESKRRSSWARPDEAYEQAVADFIRRICERDRRNPFLEDFLPFQRRVAALGKLNGLTQTLLKLTLPGVPDIYQGCELWQLALVDPDNRRPVDFEARRALLEGTGEGPLSGDWTGGGIKLDLIRRLLDLRARHPALFAEGTLDPLTVRGERRDHLVAFARQGGGQVLLVLAPRLVGRLAPEGPSLPPDPELWRGVTAELPRRLRAVRFRSVLDEREPVHETIIRQRKEVPHILPALAFRHAPVAVLIGEAGGD